MPLLATLLLGALAPALAGTTLSGAPLDASALRGKVVVLNFFATWCPPCRAETSDLVTAYRSLHARDVAFLGIDTTETAPIVRSFNGAKGVPYPTAIAPPGAYDAYAISFIPTTIVLDAKGIVRARWVGGVAPDQLAQYIAGAKAGRSVTFVSPAQRRIDAALAPAAYRFDGDGATRTAALAQLQSAIARADALENDDRNRVDDERTQREIGALQVAAGRAVRRAASDDAERRRGLALEAQGDGRLNRFADALALYRTAAQSAPNDPQLAAAVARSAYRLHYYPQMIADERRVVALTPDDGDAWSFLALGYQRARRFADAVPAYDRAIALLEAAADAHPTQLALADVADTALDLANVHVALGRAAEARRAFDIANRYGTRLDPKGPYADLARNVVERTQEGMIAVALARRGDPRTALAVAPWTGPDLPGSLASTLKYRLVVAGPANRPVTLRTTGLRPDWVASFCADGLCSPQSVAFRIPAGGVKTFEFQLVPPAPGAPPGRVAIHAPGGVVADVPTR